LSNPEIISGFALNKWNKGLRSRCW